MANPTLKQILDLIHELRDPNSEPSKKEQAKKNFEQLLTGAWIITLITYITIIKQYIIELRQQYSVSGKPAHQAIMNPENNDLGPIEPQSPTYQPTPPEKLIDLVEEDTTALAKQLVELSQLANQYNAVQTNVAQQVAQIVDAIGSVQFTNSKGITQTLRPTPQQIAQVQEIVIKKLPLTAQLTPSLVNHSETIKVLRDIHIALAIVSEANPQNSVDTSPNMLPSMAARLGGIVAAVNTQVQQQNFRPINQGLALGTTILANLEKVASNCITLQTRIEENRARLGVSQNPQQAATTQQNPNSPVASALFKRPAPQGSVKKDEEDKNKSTAPRPSPPGIKIKPENSGGTPGTTA